MKDTITTFSAISTEIEASIAKKTDDLIGAEVTKRLGHSSWQVFAIAHRIKRYRVKNQPQEIWVLDDKPLIEIWPFELNTVQEGEATKLVVTMQHRTFS